MSVSEINLAEVAARHGVQLEDVKPLDKPQRLARLRQVLDRMDVPFPIEKARGDDYYRQAEQNVSFGVGTLSEFAVDLGEYSNQQHYEKYSQIEHLSWACLIADQQRTKHQYACREYLAGEDLFEIGESFIPDYYALNARIFQQTGWQLATVSKIIPAELFFTCHSKRFFPVTTFMRKLEQDYLEEPDIGHDVAGHVATFTIPAVANVMKNHGEARNLIYAERDEQLANLSDPDGRQKILDWAEELLTYAGRIYWFTVEFGLVMENNQVKDFGAGILSSPGETVYSVDSEQSSRVLIDPANDKDLLRLATTDYLISEFQKTYFVMSSFERLDTLTPERILWASKLAVKLPHYTWREIVPGDNVINVGSVVTSPNEKYFRLMANQPLDECLTRTSIRNLRMFANGQCDAATLSEPFKVAPPEIPSDVVAWFKEKDAQNGFAEMEAEMAKAKETM